MGIETAIICLALNIYFEARGEPVIAQRAVAQVTMNRADNDPDRVCTEVFRPRQFSWTNRLSKSSKSDPNSLVNKLIKNTHSDPWNRSLEIARSAISGEYRGEFNGATHFYNPREGIPKWSKKLTRVQNVGSFVLMK